MRGQRARHRWTGTLLLVVSLFLPPALSFLHAGEDHRRTQVESSHHPSRCAPGHDHAACIQLQHTRVAVVHVWEVRLRLRVVPDAPSPSSLEGPRWPRPSGLGPRAPPLLTA